MNFKDFGPEKLTKLSFYWSQIRLVIAAVALFLGGIPPVFYLVRVTPGLFNLVGQLLIICWIISGIAAAYLLFQWFKHNKTVFGAKHREDVTAFFVSVVSGLNLGIVGIFGRNIGMSITTNRVVFIVVGILYLLAAYRLQRRFNNSNKKLFW